VLRAVPAGRRSDLFVLAGLLLLAAVLRFVDLPTRGPWDADQGHDMLVLRALVRDGVLPLLGPPTSIGDFHHGALYYYLLAPAAALGGGNDPLPVAGAIALAGTAAVGVTWWLARSIGGPVAGAVAGLLLAVSSAAIEESTFIWNPNVIALSASVALACGWRAWTTGRARWWLGAAAAVAVTMQSHVLGTVLLPPLAAFLLVDARRRADPEAQTRVLVAGLAGAAIVAATYLPLLAHELGNDFTESRAALEFLRSGGPGSPLDPATRLLVVALRILSWPLTGLFVDGLPVAVAAGLAVVALATWRWRVGAGDERTAVRWLGATLAWSVAALSLGAASLTTVVRALPVDHYHAFLDPLVVVLAGLGLARVFERHVLGRAAAALAVGGLVAWNLAIAPPAVAPDGGYPAAQAAADRVLRAAGERSIALVSLPDFKAPDAYGYPLTVAGVELNPPGEAKAVVVLCDARFSEAIGAPCGGPAEDRTAPGARLLDRFEAQPDRWLSVYAAGP
jgi:4-amino-4-deoxy-L-arabinose transferase-like glycosyltransferase